MTPIIIVTRMKKSLRAITLVSAVALTSIGCQSFLPTNTADSSIDSNSIQPNSSQSVNLNIERWTTNKGADVLFLKNTALPLLDIHVSFEAGAMRDNDLHFGDQNDTWHHGLAGFTNALIGEATANGSTTQTAQQISENFERQGAQFATDFGQRTSELTLRSLTGEPLEQSLQQFTAVLKDAAFTPDAYERVKAQLVNYMRYMKTQPKTQAGCFYNEAFFGSHDLSRSKLGTLESIEEISIDDIHHFYKRFYTNQTMQIVLTGDVSTKEAKAIAESISNTRPLGEKVDALDVFTQQKSGHEHKTFDATQTQIIMGLQTIGRDDKDYAAFKLANDVLGGGSTSRLYKAVRDDKGLTYSIYSSFSAVLDQGEFNIAMQTAAGQSHEAIEVTLATLNEFIEKGVTQEELEQSKASYRMAFSQAFTSNRGINRALTTLARGELSDSYYGDFLQQIEAADLAQVNKAIKRLLDKDKLLIVTLGQ